MRDSLLHVAQQPLSCKQLVVLPLFPCVTGVIAQQGIRGLLQGGMRDSLLHVLQQPLSCEQPVVLPLSPCATGIIAHPGAGGNLFKFPQQPWSYRRLVVLQ